MCYFEKILRMFVLVQVTACLLMVACALALNYPRQRAGKSEILVVKI